MSEGMLFWVDLSVMIYLCWKIIQQTRGKSPDLGLLSFRVMDQKK
jgi:hypothetical protein